MNKKWADVLTLVKKTRQASVRPALWEPYQLYNELADGIVELLDRVEKAERRVSRLKNREQKALRNLREVKATLHRVRELHPKYTSNSGLSWCEKCQEEGGGFWPCPTVRAMEGDE